MSLISGQYTPNNTISKIELIERNVEEINKSSYRTAKFFLRTGRPGRLFLKPNYTAFTKTNLGSIPSKLEKTLVKTDSNKPLSTYINNTISSFKETKDFEKINKEEKDIRNYTTSFSSKGFGVGFVSKVNRFGESLSGYLPGPADYSPEKYFTILSSVEKSPFGKSLFKKKTSASLSTTSNDIIYNNRERNSKTFSKQKKSFTSIKDEGSNNKMDSDNKKGSYFFSSTSDRFNGNIFGNKNLYPGPGKYFFVNDEIKVKYPETLSSEFVLPPKKKINPIHYFGLNENDKKKFGFQLINKMKKKKYNSLWSKSKINFEDKIFNKYNKSNISLANNSTRLTSLTNNNNTSNIASLNLKDNISKIYNNSIKTEYISIVPDNKSLNLSVEDDKNKETRNKNEKKKLSKQRKKDNFSLSPPRWDEGYFHDNGSHFQVPGPAYYAPPIQNNKKSFNLNNKDFIFTNSLPFKNDNYGTVSSVLI